MSSRRDQLVDLRQDTRLVSLLRHAIESSSDDSGWALLAHVGANIAKQSPEFDPRNYGFKKLVELVNKQPYLEVRKEKIGSGSRGTTIFVRLK